MKRRNHGGLEKTQTERLKERCLESLAKTVRVLDVNADDPDRIVVTLMCETPCETVYLTFYVNDKGAELMDACAE
jgi:glutamate formiminotransferase